MIFSVALLMRRRQQCFVIWIFFPRLFLLKNLEKCKSQLKNFMSSILQFHTIFLCSLISDLNIRLSVCFVAEKFLLTPFL